VLTIARENLLKNKKKRKHFIENNPNGKYITYWDRGIFVWRSKNIKTTEQYKNGLLHGECTTFFHSGEIASITNYKNGEPDGLNRSFDISGNIMLEESFQQGKKISHKSFYGNGSIQRKVDYEDGIQIAGEDYYENGNIEAVYTFTNKQKSGKENLRTKTEFFYKNGNLKFRATLMDKDSFDWDNWVEYICNALQVDYEEFAIRPSGMWWQIEEYYSEGQLKKVSSYGQRVQDYDVLERIPGNEYLDTSEALKKGLYKHRVRTHPKDIATEYQNIFYTSPWASGMEVGTWTWYQKDGSIRKIEDFKMTWLTSDSEPRKDVYYFTLDS